MRFASRHMKKILLITLIALFGFGMIASAGIAAKTVQISTPKVEQLAKGSTQTKVAFTLNNTDSINHDLIAVTSPAAKKVQLHVMDTVNGQATMRQIHGVQIPAKKETTFTDNALHVMLIHVNKNMLQKGKSIPLTLLFADGSHISTNALMQ